MSKLLAGLRAVAAGRGLTIGKPRRRRPGRFVVRNSEGAVVHHADDLGGIARFLRAITHA
jgi:hypothetical protein